MKEEEESESGSAENDEVKVRPGFEIETRVLHNTRAVGNYQQTTAAKRAAYISVVEMAIHFRCTGASWGELHDNTNYGAMERLVLHTRGGLMR